jgi:hypothetical protein
MLTLRSCWRTLQYKSAMFISTLEVTAVHLSRPSLSPLFDWRGIRLLKLLILRLSPSTWFAPCGKNILLNTPLELTQTYTRTALPTGYCELTGAAAPRPGEGVHHVKVKERTWVAVSIPDGGLIWLQIRTVQPAGRQVLLCGSQFTGRFMFMLSVVRMPTGARFMLHVVRMPTGARHFSRPTRPTLGLLFNGYREFLPRLCSERGVRLTTHLHRVQRLRMSGAIPLLPLYAFMVCKGHQFTFLQ